MTLFEGKNILITGGTGSFGQALVKKLRPLGLSEIRILSRDEKKQEEMRHQFSNDPISFFIGDVRDRNSLSEPLKGVDLVFHAAALKQVPSCEFFPLEAIKTNVIGTSNVLDEAITNGVGRVVCLSTDKAVYPINAMGMTKALMEKMVVAKARKSSETTICATRYGNVMGSRGSVIPRFFNQVSSDLPITITDPAMTRFMMSLEEAVDLVLFAYSKGSSGDIFVQKSPAVSIGNLVKAVLKICDKENHEVITIGKRHGEKIYETLLSSEDVERIIDMGDYYKIPADKRDLNYQAYEVNGEEKSSQALEYNSQNTQQLSVDEMVTLLHELDPNDMGKL